MWIVRLALRRPYTVAVMAILVLMFGVMATVRMRKDIFPTIDIPVVIVVWSYPGLAAEDMERRVVIISERAFSTTVNGISRLESQSIDGIGTIKVYFEPGADIGAAIAQITSVSNTVTRILPPGITPPNIVQYNASNVPVAQLTLSSSTLGEEEIYDHALNFIRVRLFTIPGLSTPAPYGGKQRQIMVDLDPEAIAARGLSPQLVVNALLATNIITPAGTIRIATTEYDVTMNSSPVKADTLADYPLALADGAIVRLGDVAHVHDGYAVQQNIVRVDGARATYLAILRKAGASTLAVVDATKQALPMIKAAAPGGLDLRIDFDQSVFVRASINGVVREAAIAAALVALMVLVFLGSWRGVVIVATSIPLSIAVALVGLDLVGQTLNVMTMGGLALAIGMLVDDATVELENIERNRHIEHEDGDRDGDRDRDGDGDGDGDKDGGDRGKLKVTRAILDAASQIALPALAATSTICVVFFPVVLLTGPGRFLFSALALAVVLAMIASYVFSRTLVPALANRLMPNEPLGHPGNGWWARANRARDRGFDKLRAGYTHALDAVLCHRAFAVGCAVVVAVALAALFTVVGTDFFPRVDAGQMRLHVRAPLGTRIEDTEHLIADVEHRIRDIIPADDLQLIDDNIGIPQSYNLAFVQTDSLGGQDADVLIALRPGHGTSTIDYQRALRAALPHDFPGTLFYFQPADIVTQVLDFGLPAPIDVEVEGPKFEQLVPVARELRDAIRRIPGTVDVHIAQALDHPALHVAVDRARAAEVGLTERDVANDLLVSLASSALVSPSFWLSPEGVNYIVAAQTPLRLAESVGAILRTPIATSGGGLGSAGGAFGGMLPTPEPSQLVDSPFAPPQGVAQTLGDIASIEPSQTMSLISHDEVQRVLEVRLDVDGRDLGGVADAIDDAIAQLGKLPPATQVHVRGQVESMRTSFRSLELGVVVAIVLVYLILVVLFQSFTDPLVIAVAIPGALTGALLMLAVTGTTLNVESLMGTIMSIGVATSNSILLVSFANEVREGKGGDRVSARAAARAAGRTRLRPVLMTALAMILGMLPMAFGLGEGGEQNAPLARAVIGGLGMATVVTLFLVPTVYSLVRRAPPRKRKQERAIAKAQQEHDRG